MPVFQAVSHVQWKRDSESTMLSHSMKSYTKVRVDHSNCLSVLREVSIACLVYCLAHVCGMYLN